MSKKNVILQILLKERYCFFFGIFRVKFQHIIAMQQPALDISLDDTSVVPTQENIEKIANMKCQPRRIEVFTRSLVLQHGMTHETNPHKIMAETPTTLARHLFRSHFAPHEKRTSNHWLI